MFTLNKQIIDLMIFFWVVTPYMILCRPTIMEEYAASVFGMTELWFVDADITLGRQWVSYIGVL